jgi:hypothetical protein
VVRIDNIEVGRGADAGKLTILWTATDKNLGSQPITLYWSENGQEPWTPIISKIENTRRYVWTMPETLPFKFFVRVEAVDLAGNVGIADTPDHVKVDLAQPKVRVIGVEPIGK